MERLYSNSWIEKFYYKPLDFLECDATFREIVSIQRYNVKQLFMTGDIANVPPTGANYGAENNKNAINEIYLLYKNPLGHYGKEYCRCRSAFTDQWIPSSVRALIKNKLNISGHP